MPFSRRGFSSGKQALFLGNLRKGGPRVSFLNIFVGAHKTIRFTLSNQQLHQLTWGRLNESRHRDTMRNTKLLLNLFSETKCYLSTGKSDSKRQHILFPIDLVHCILLSCISHVLSFSVIFWPQIRQVYQVTLSRMGGTGTRRGRGGWKETFRRRGNIRLRKSSCVCFRFSFAEWALSQSV